MELRDATDFLPGGGSPTPSIKCYFGPPQRQTLRELQIFDVIEHR